MKSSFLSILSAVAALAVTQSVQATSPDYVLSTSTGASIVPGTTDIGLYHDDATQSIALPFPVAFYDQVFNSVTVSTNGNLQFSSTSNDPNGCINGNNGNNVIAPAWSDLDTTDAANGEGIFTSVSGVAPNRIFNIEWRAINCCGGGVPTVNFEARLYEGQRRIDFIYGNIADAGHQISIGVQRDNGSQYTAVSCGITVPAAGTQYTFTIENTCIAPPPNLVAWWPGDGNADDSVGGHNGTILGGVTFGSGEVAQAFSFDGTGAHIAVGDVDVPATFTIDAWINPTDLSSNPRIFSKDDDTTARSYELRVTAAGGLEATVNSPSLTFYATNTSPIVTGSFQHIAVTYDGNASAGEKFKFYVNGVNIPASPVIGNDAGGTPSNTSVAAVIGIAGNRQTGPFSGLIDEVEVFGRVLSSTEIEGIYIAGSAGKCKCTPPPANMVSWWPGEGDGNDIQGGNRVTVSGSGVGFGPGEVGQAFSFTGNGYLTAGDPNNLRFTGTEVTLDAWVNPTNAGESGVIAGKTADSANDYLLYLSGGSVVGLIKAGGSEITIAGGVPPAGTWTHVALVYDGSTIKTYYNGTLFDTTSKSGNLDGDNSEVAIGGRAAGDLNFVGFIDEVEVFNRALSGDDIARIYHAGSAGKCRPCTPAPTEMVSWWPGDGNLTDIQGGHNGTGSGGGPSFAGGEVGQAMDFDGVDDFFTAANVPDPNKAFTFDTWVYWRGSTGSGQQTLVEKLDTLGGGSYLLAIADSGVVVSVIGGNLPGGLTFNTSQTIPVNQWTHIAETDDGSNVTIYINGQLATSVTADRDPSSELLYFGSSGSQFFLNGEMDEIEIFSRALTQSEVQAIYDAGSGGKCKPELPAERQFFNISSRASVGTGDDVAIGGFIIQSDPAGPKQNRTNGPATTKRVLIRGIGPSLAAFSVPNPLQDPVLSLYDNNGTLITTNDNWGDAPNASDIQATGFAPSDPSESAILSTLNADSSYTAILSGKNNTTGIGLVEVYDVDLLGDTHLINISTRGFVDTGDDVLIGGLIVQGGTPTRIVMRAIGPSLQAFGISDALPDPSLALYDANGVIIASNDDWASSPDAAAITTAGLNPSDSKESAILFTPAPGSYTAIVSGNGPTPTGVGLVEAFQLKN